MIILVQVLYNNDVRPTTPLIKLMEHDFWGQPIQLVDSHKSFRPLTTLSYRLNFALHGFDGWGYHLGNVLVHASTCGLVVILYHTLCTLYLPGSEHAQLVAALAGLLHAVHPVSPSMLLLGFPDFGVAFRSIPNLLPTSLAERIC